MKNYYPPGSDISKEARDRLRKIIYKTSGSDCFNCVDTFYDIVKRISKEFPNDAELGQLMRRFINKKELEEDAS